MKRVYVTFLLVALLITPSVLIVYAAPTFPPAFLKGTKINVIAYTQTIDSGEQSYVIHGFLAGSVPWKELSPAERKEWKKEATFSLAIDGETMDLKKWTHKYQTYVNPAGDEYHDVMLILFYVQFEANQFNPGDELIFTGIWTDPNGATATNNCTVTFT